jgi:hypothetical protein
MFGEGAIPSSESPAPSALGVPEPGGRKLFLAFRKLSLGFRRLFLVFRNPFGRSGLGKGRLPGVGLDPGDLSLGSLVDHGWRRPWKVVGELDSSSGNLLAKSAERESRAPFPYWEMLLVSGFGFRIGVRERYEVRRTGDWSRPDLTYPVLFLLTPVERVPDGSLPGLAGRAPPSC